MELRRKQVRALLIVVTALALITLVQIAG